MIHDEAFLHAFNYPTGARQNAKSKHLHTLIRIDTLIERPAGFLIFINLRLANKSVYS